MDSVPKAARGWDRRYVTYETGVKGLNWAGYKGIKAKDDIESQAWAREPKFLVGEKEFTIPSKEAEVLEVLDTEHVEILQA